MRTSLVEARQRFVEAGLIVGDAGMRWPGVGAVSASSERSSMQRNNFLRFLSFACFGLIGSLLLSHPGACAEAPIQVAMNPASWQADGKTGFEQREGLPNGLLNVQKGTALLQNLEFRNGTIEFDIRPLDDGMPGIQFRRRNADSMEILYLRPSPECPVAQDCIQYVPRVHGVMPWEMYPQYQTAAPVSERGWSHLKLVISTHRMKLFVNHAVMPAMTVGQLAGESLEGSLALVGPAAFANLTVSPGATEGLPPDAAPDPEAGDRGLVRHWQVSLPSSRALDGVAALSQMPGDTSSWRPITAEAYGLVNLSRLYGSPTGRSTGALAWLKTDIRSDRVQTRKVSLGFLHEATVFVNGRLMFSGQNIYQPGTPVGRLSLRNGSFDLPLQPGVNQVAVALNNILIPGHAHYGWGLQFRLDDPSGLRMASR